MSLEEKIKEDLKEAMKASDSLRKETLSMLRSQIHNKAIEQGKQEEGLTDEEVLKIISTETKRRREAAEEFKKGGREELAEKEIKEQEILKKYLPPQLSREEIRSEIEKIIKETGTNNKKDFGMIMAKSMEAIKGRADGLAVKEELEKLLQ